MNHTVIKAENVSKKFCKTLKRSMFYGVVDIGRDMMGYSTSTDVLRKDEFWALKNINFEVKQGEVLGIIGPNGSGKSTLLKMINGIYMPDKGKIEVSGRVGALIEIGAGFHPILTGRENIYVNGGILGMSKKEIDGKIDSIVEFADIGDFLDTPVKYYSSGMFVRLGFAIAVHCEPDILLVDEVLAVGDVNFQHKCLKKIGELKKNTSILLVSHNMHMITSHCQKVCYIDARGVIFCDDPEKAVSKYLENCFKVEKGLFIEKVVTGNSHFVVSEVNIEPTLKEDVRVAVHDDLDITIEYKAFREYSNVILDVVIQAREIFGGNLFQLTNNATKQPLDLPRGEGKIKCSIKGINFNNIRGRLFITMWSANKEDILLWWRNIPVFFEGDGLGTGIVTYKATYKVTSE